MNHLGLLEGLCKLSGCKCMLHTRLSLSSHCRPTHQPELHKSHGCNCWQARTPRGCLTMEDGIDTGVGVPSLLSMADSPPSETLELRLLLPWLPPAALGLYCSPSLGAGLKGDSVPARQDSWSVGRQRATATTKIGLYCSPSLQAGLKGDSEPARQSCGSFSQRRATARAHR